MLRSILYVSNSALAFSTDQKKRIGALVQQSRKWNESVGITGALVYTERNFVQFIEGPNDAIADLLSKLRADPRHSGITVIEDTRADRRHFQRWSLAYSGPDAYIDHDLAPLLQQQAAARCPDLPVKLRTRLSAMASV